MVLPINLVLIRHGQSEGNLAWKVGSEFGDPSYYANENFKKKHTSLFRLTHLGVDQAKSAGEYLKKEIQKFDKFYVSEYIRAMETAYYLEIEKAKWQTNFFLRERDWGSKEHRDFDERLVLKKNKNRKRDGFFFVPKRGESLAHVCLRLQIIIKKLEKHSDKNVIIVCHGEVMSVFRVILENWSMHKWREYSKVSKTEPKQQIHNGQIFIYTRRDPETDKLRKEYRHMKSICPWDLSLCNKNWVKINEESAKRKTGEELYKQVLRIPLVLTNSTPHPVPVNYSYDNYHIPVDVESVSEDDDEEGEGEEEELIIVKRETKKVKKKKVSEGKFEENPHFTSEEEPETQVVEEEVMTVKKKKKKKKVPKFPPPSPLVKKNLGFGSLNKTDNLTKTEEKK